MIRMQVEEIKFRLRAIEMALEEKGVISKEEVVVYCDKSRKENSDKREEMRREFWGDIHPGSAVSYFRAEGIVISKSDRPFEFLAVNITKINDNRTAKMWIGKMAKVGNIVTVLSPHENELMIKSRRSGWGGWQSIS